MPYPSPVYESSNIVASFYPTGFRMAHYSVINVEHMVLSITLLMDHGCRFPSTGLGGLLTGHVVKG